MHLQSVGTSGRFWLVSSGFTYMSGSRLGLLALVSWFCATWLLIFKMAHPGFLVQQSQSSKRGREEAQGLLRSRR